MPRALDAGDAPRGIPARAQREHPDPYAPVGAHAPHHPRRVPLRRDIADPRRARVAGDRPVEPVGHIAIGSDSTAVLANIAPAGALGPTGSRLGIKPAGVTFGA